MASVIIWRADKLRKLINLEFEKDATQEERREVLLKFQSQHTDQALWAVCDLLCERYFPNVEDVEELVSNPKYKTHFMMSSEWMWDEPHDFKEKWSMVPCPIGRQVRVVACNNITRVYGRKHIFRTAFRSALPGGGNLPGDGNCEQSAILDCILVEEEQVYYVRDVLWWDGQPFTNYNAANRLDWIAHKVDEIKELKERDSERNEYPILSLPRISCKADLEKSLVELVPKFPELDGLLFYQDDAKYCFGITPLVTWLKPFMLREVLNIQVPSPYNEKPDNYIDMDDYIISHQKHETSDCKICVKYFVQIKHIPRKSYEQQDDHQ